MFTKQFFWPIIPPEMSVRDELLHLYNDLCIQRSGENPTEFGTEYAKGYSSHRRMFMGAVKERLYTLYGESVREDMESIEADNAKWNSFD